MTKLGRVVMGLVLVISAAGCFEHTYTFGQGAPVGPVVYDEWQSQWLGGLIGEETHDVRAICPSGNATIHDEQSFLNGLVAVLTSGIYTPTTVTIRCETGGEGEITLREKEIIAIAESPFFLERVQEVLPERLGDAQLIVQSLDADH
jgi:hypothetical protein